MFEYLLGGFLLAKLLDRDRDKPPFIFNITWDDSKIISVNFGLPVDDEKIRKVLKNVTFSYLEQIDEFTRRNPVEYEDFAEAYQDFEEKLREQGYNNASVTLYHPALRRYYNALTGW